jgi:rod shape determining protein RodA
LHPLLRKFLGFNWLHLGLMVALMCYGIYAIYSATWMRDDTFWRDQIKWAFICFPVFIAISVCDYRKWVRFGALPLYLLSLAALLLVLVKGQKVYGAKSWLNLGFFNFEPSQLSILSGMLVLSLFLSQTKNVHSFLRLLACGAIVGAPCLLILLQPDLGEALMWVPMMFAVMFIGGVQLRYLVCVALLGLAAMPLAINFGLKTYQQNRILTFLDPSRDPLNAGWALNQCLISIGSGGMYGKGFKDPNSLNALGFLPATAAHNDFIFAVMGEQHGFIGGCILIGVFGALLLTSLYVGFKAGDDLGTLLAVCVTMVIFAHVFENIGMTIQVAPITGVPLPLISYSGSFLLIIMACFGILQSVWIHRRSID